MHVSRRTAALPSSSEQGFASEDDPDSGLDPRLVLMSVQRARTEPQSRLRSSILRLFRSRQTNGAGAGASAGAPAPVRRARLVRLCRDEQGAVTAEYAVVILAAVAFAGLLVAILRSDEVRAMLVQLVQNALGSAG